MIDGTHMPTNIPASLFAVTPTPNHNATEKRKDKNAASITNKSPLVNIGNLSCVCIYGWAAPMHDADHNIVRAAQGAVPVRFRRTKRYLDNDSIHGNTDLPPLNAQAMHKR